MNGVDFLIKPWIESKLKYDLMTIVGGLSDYFSERQPY